MKKSISRRDFLNGAAFALAGFATLPYRNVLAFGQGEKLSPITALSPYYYPPALTGMRGSHAGSFEVAHKLAWLGEKPEEYSSLDETYDLVVVGGGISGLTAAYLYRQQMGEDKKVLILDNHDDFGGHAKRNEFTAEGRTLLGVGGSVNLETTGFSTTAHRVLHEIGVDLDKLHAAREPDYLLSSLYAESGYFLNKKEYGKNKIIQGDWGNAWVGGEGLHELVASLDLSAEQSRRLIDLAEGEKDLLDEFSISETMSYLGKTSYETFLKERAGLSPETIMLFDPYHKIFMGHGSESTSAEEAILLGYPGANSIGLAGATLNKILVLARDTIRFPLFPDGNASVARLMVRKLIPKVAPGNTMEDVIDARFDYSQLDSADCPVRIRLNSTAVNVENVDGGVEVAYVQNGKSYKVRGKQSILACYNGLIPHLCPELSQSQKDNLKYGVKTPLVMANVMLRNGSAVNASGPAQYHCPGSFFSVVTKAPPVSLGNYDAKSEGKDPLVLWMCYAPAPYRTGEQSERDQFRQGRHILYRTSFATFEEEVKSQLNGMFAANRFDADRDIEAITVNRWSHGYSYSYNKLFDPDWEEGKAPHELGRAPIGRISIANADSEAYPSLQAGIDAAARAVNELSSFNRANK